MAAALGPISQLAISSVSPANARFDFQPGSNIGVDETLVDGNGLRGTLSPKIERVRVGNRRIGGQLVFQPNSAEMALLLPWINGAAAAGNDYALADSLLTRYVAIDRNDGNLYTYDECAVDRAVFRASEGGPLTLTLDVVGGDETVSGSFPSLNISTINGPFLFTDLVITVGATEITPKYIELTIDNGIDKERFFNSQTLVTSNKLNRVITFRTEVPLGDLQALYAAGEAGSQVVMTYTNGGASLVQSLVKVAYPRKPFPPMGRAENMLEISGRAYMSGSTRELVTTLAPGP